MQTALYFAVTFLPVAVGITEGAAPESLARYGLLGVVLGYFMIRQDKQLSGIKHEVAGLNRTMLIEILSRPSTTAAGKRSALKELGRVDPELARENAHYAAE